MSFDFEHPNDLLTQEEVARHFGWTTRHQRRFEEQLFAKLGDGLRARGLNEEDAQQIIMAMLSK